MPFINPLPDLLEVTTRVRYVRHHVVVTYAGIVPSRYWCQVSMAHDILPDLVHAMLLMHCYMVLHAKLLLLVVLRMEVHAKLILSSLVSPFIVLRHPFHDLDLQGNGGCEAYRVLQYSRPCADTMQLDSRRARSREPPRL